MSFSRYIIIPITLSLIFGGCSKQVFNYADKTSKNAETASEKVAYIPLLDYNANQIEDIKLNNANSGQIAETTKGYYYLSETIDNINNYVVSFYDKHAKKLWEKEYQGNSPRQASTKIIALKDGFLLTNDSDIYFFNSEGTRTGDYKDKEALENAATLSCDDYFFRIGTIDNNGDKDISVVKLDRYGRAWASYKLKGNNIDCFENAEVLNDLLIIKGNTQSTDGDFKSVQLKNEREDFIAGLSVKNLEVKWLYSNSSNFFMKSISTDSQNNVLYALMTNNIDKSYITKISKDGEAMWNTEIMEGVSPAGLSVFSNGSLYSYGSITSDKNNNYNKNGYIYTYNSGGTNIDKENVADCPILNVREVPGGYIAESERIVKILSKSPESYDTETVLIKYDSDNTLQCRKTYDQFKDDKAKDCIYIAEDGKIISQ